MKTIVKSREADADANSSSLSGLPDEIILEILNKIKDLKSLCLCYMVSKRFSSIVSQVDAISFTAPLINPCLPKRLFSRFIKPFNLLRRMFKPRLTPPPALSSVHRKSFKSAIRFFKKFTGVRSFSMELPPSIHNPSLFKWKVKFGNKIESFIFLLPKSVRDNHGFYLNGSCDEQVVNELTNDMVEQNVNIAIKYLMDAVACHMMLLFLLKGQSMLEKVCITVSGRIGRVSLSGVKLRQVKEWVRSVSKTVLIRGELPEIVNNCYIPVLKLPVSGYEMKGVYFLVMDMKGIQGGIDGLMDIEDGFEDKEEAAYTEAVMEIWEKHKGSMERLL